MDAASLITSARRRAGLTGRELARRAGTSATTLSAYEHGRVDPSVATLRRIIRACGFEPEIRLSKVVIDEQRTQQIEDLLEFTDRVGGRRSFYMVAPVWPQVTRR